MQLLQYKYKFICIVWFERYVSKPTGRNKKFSLPCCLKFSITGPTQRKQHVSLFSSIYHLVCQSVQYIIWCAILFNITSGVLVSSVYHLVCQSVRYTIWCASQFNISSGVLVSSIYHLVCQSVRYVILCAGQFDIPYIVCYSRQSFELARQNISQNDVKIPNPTSCLIHLYTRGLNLTCFKS